MKAKLMVMILAALFLTGCDSLQQSLGIHNGHNVGGLGLYPFGGQSNADFLAQHIGSTFLNGLVINTAVGSTSMSRWEPTGDLYENMVVQTSATLKTDPTAYVAGYVFWNGETDANAGPSAYNLWPQRFAAMVQDFRKHFGNVPVVFVQITDTGVPGRAELRALQAQISIPNVMMVPTDGIVHLGDHTDDAGYATMAARVADAMKKLQAGQ